MRVLFTAAAVPSHIHSQVPIAHALKDAGHEVAFATGPKVLPQIAHLGFLAFPAGPAHSPPRGQPPADPRQAFWWGFEQGFLGLSAADRLAALLPLCAQWGPDVIVRENTEFAGCVAAEALGIPHAIVQNGNFAVLGYLPRTPLTQRLDTLREVADLPPDPDLAMLFRYLLLLPMPRSFHDPALALPPTAHFLRPLTFDRTGDESVPEWIDAMPPQPTIYMTLGTVFNRRVDLFAMVIAALRDEPVNLIVTVGRDQDPDQFGPQPENVHIARYIPQSLLLTRCDLMINMGGMNSVRSACEHGVPLVLFPLLAEQAFNAGRCAALGMARVLDAGTLTPEGMRGAVLGVLGDGTYRANAERVRDELAAMPGPEHAVQLLERLAVEKQPLTTG